jgi:hypothetical protein
MTALLANKVEFKWT